MKNKFRVPFSFLVIGLFSMALYSCSKDHDPPPDEFLDSSSIDYSVSNRSVQPSQTNDEEIPIVLGNQNNNPFTVQNMTLAYNNLYNQSISSLTATHKYVKFLPADGEHLVELDDWESENLTAVFSFPLDYEITTPGDIYYDPSAPDSVYTFRYASVPIGMTLPNVPNTIISDLFIPPYSSYLTEQAFYQVNEEYDGNTERIEGDPPGEGDPNPPVNPCDPSCLDYPCCKLPWIDCNSIPCTPVLPPGCSPGSANWPDCLDLDPPPVGPDVYPPPPPPPPPPVELCECDEYEQGVVVHTYIVKLLPGESCEDFEEDGFGIDIRCRNYTDSGSGNGNGTTSTNECGCPIPPSTRMPAGCVQVEDDDADFEAVKKVMVKTRDNWFRSHVTFTDEMGCWRVNTNYSKRWTWLWVKFQNDNAKVRAVRKWYYWKAAVIADDYVDLFRNPPFNNFLVKYENNEDDIKSLTRMYWGCAHTINADFEYREMAGSDGIIRPRTKLNYLLDDNNGSPGGAPMLQNNLFGSWVQLLTVPFNVSTGVIGYLSLSLYPDITSGYGNDIVIINGVETLFPRSGDNVKATLLHELGHASHHQLVGETYWHPYRNHIINNSLAGNGSYGSFNNFASGSDPGRVALGEAIGNFMGNRYGGAINGSEGVAFDRPGTIPERFIPRGLFFDLIDTNQDIIVDPNTAVGGLDNISGFTPSMLFQSLSPNVNSIRDFRDRLATLHLSSTPNTLQDFNDFVDLYDVFN